MITVVLGDNNFLNFMCIKTDLRDYAYCPRSHIQLVNVLGFTPESPWFQTLGT